MWPQKDAVLVLEAGPGNTGGRRMGGDWKVKTGEEAEERGEKDGEDIGEEESVEAVR